MTKNKAKIDEISEELTEHYNAIAEFKNSKLRECTIKFTLNDKILKKYNTTNAELNVNTNNSAEVLFKKISKKIAKLETQFLLLTKPDIEQKLKTLEKKYKPLDIHNTLVLIKGTMNNTNTHNDISALNLDASSGNYKMTTLGNLICRSIFDNKLDKYDIGNNLKIFFPGTAFGTEDAQDHWYSRAHKKEDNDLYEDLNTLVIPEYNNNWFEYGKLGEKTAQALKEIFNTPKDIKSEGVSKGTSQAATFLRHFIDGNKHIWNTDNVTLEIDAIPKSTVNSFINGKSCLQAISELEPVLLKNRNFHFNYVNYEYDGDMLHVSSRSTLYKKIEEKLVKIINKRSVCKRKTELNATSDTSNDSNHKKGLMNKMFSFLSDKMKKIYPTKQTSKGSNLKLKTLNKVKNSLKIIKITQNKTNYQLEYDIKIKNTSVGTASKTWVSKINNNALNNDLNAIVNSTSNKDIAFQILQSMIEFKKSKHWEGFKAINSNRIGFSQMIDDKGFKKILFNKLKSTNLTDKSLSEENIKMFRKISAEIQTKCRHTGLGTQMGRCFIDKKTKKIISDQGMNSFRFAQILDAQGILDKNTQSSMSVG